MSLFPQRFSRGSEDMKISEVALNTSPELQLQGLPLLTATSVGVFVSHGHDPQTSGSRRLITHKRHAPIPSPAELGLNEKSAATLHRTGGVLADGDFFRSSSGCFFFFSDPPDLLPKLDQL